MDDVCGGAGSRTWTDTIQADWQSWSNWDAWDYWDQAAWDEWNKKDKCASGSGGGRGADARTHELIDSGQDKDDTTQEPAARAA